MTFTMHACVCIRQNLFVCFIFICVISFATQPGYITIFEVINSGILWYMTTWIMYQSIAWYETFNQNIFYDHHTTNGGRFILIIKLRPRKHGCHLADDLFKCIFFNENVWVLVKISPKFADKSPINNILTLVQVMAWRRAGDKPLSEPMMVILPTHLCVTRFQWVKATELAMAANT